MFMVTGTSQYFLSYQYYIVLTARTIIDVFVTVNEIKKLNIQNIYTQHVKGEVDEILTWTDILKTIIL